MTEESFIKDTLQDHASYMVNLFRKDLRRKRLKKSKSGGLSDSFHFSVVTGAVPKIMMSFFGYGRVLDIWHYTRRRNRKSIVRDDVWGTQSRKKRSRRTNWYARNLYGSANQLITTLSTEYKQEEKQRLKEIIHKQVISINL